MILSLLAAGMIAAVQPSPGAPKADGTAVIGVLNKRSGRAEMLTLRPGEARSWDRLTIVMKTCEVTPPWERAQTGAFVQVDERQANGRVARLFSGWLFAESPSLNAVQHPVYDVWVRSCAMRPPETDPAPPARRSSAVQSPSTATAAASRRL